MKILTTVAMSLILATTSPAISSEVAASVVFTSDLAGKASYYNCCGGRTANGDRFNKNAMTAAMNLHTMKKYGIKYGDYVTVKSNKNGRTVTVKINDRMGHSGRVIDLTEGAMRKLGGISSGVIPVQIDIH